MWKVYNIHTDKIIKAGFKNEDEAKEWVETRDFLSKDDYMVDEMDQDEEDEWLERVESDEEDEEDEVAEEIDSDMSYDSYYDGDDLADDYDQVLDQDEEDSF